MKKIILTTITLIVCMTTSLAEFVSIEECGIMTVNTDFYKVKFFPKHMFPYQIEISGVKIKPEYFDSLYLRKDNKRYFLNKDRYAEVKLISNNGENVVVQTTGTYCYNNSKVAPGKVKAVYTYRFGKTSPIVDIAIVVTKTDNTQWTELCFLKLGFKINPFLTLLNHEINSPVTLTTLKNKNFRSSYWSVFSDGQIALGIIGEHTQAGYDLMPTKWSKKNYCFYLSRSAVSNWESTKIELSSKLYFGPAKSKDEYKAVIGRLISEH